MAVAPAIASLSHLPVADSTSLADAVRAALALPEVAVAPLPGGGRTGDRLALLRALARWDVSAGRLVEAHLDAVAILAELGTADGPRTAKPGELWAVWAAEPPGTGLAATRAEHGWALTGRKPWCSAASSATHALVTAAAQDGRRLFAVDLAAGGRVRPVPGGWAAAGMAQTDTWSVDFDAAPAVAVGGVRSYLDRPGFWHGAIGVAACWLGGADAVLRPLVERSAAERLDPHGLAHLGAAAAAVHAAGVTLDAAAAAIDADPLDADGRAELVARQGRAVVEHAAQTALDRVGRALGAAPLCQDGDHARHVQDLEVYLRQSHAERDLEALGTLVGALAS